MACSLQGDDKNGGSRLRGLADITVLLYIPSCRSLTKTRGIEVSTRVSPFEGAVLEVCCHRHHECKLRRVL